MLQGKKIIIGISGGIAAYKSLYLIRLFRKAGAQVKVVATENAMQFVTRVTIESLSENRLYDKVFSPENDYTTEHISLTDWADVMIVAPATANIIAKYAHGIADDALSTTLVAFNKQVFVAPAMNVKMYEHFTFQRNLQYLKEQGIQVIEPGEGYLACGYEGKGRMEEPEAIFQEVERYLNASETFAGKKILITAGPTHEAIDPVRFIGNHSSGKMGLAIAQELACQGAEVTLVCGPVNANCIHKNIKRVDVVSAQQMYEASLRYFPGMDAAILTAAVADYRPQEISRQKIKRNSKALSLELIPNPDILEALGKSKSKTQILVGFALETNNEIENARAKLMKKNLDFIVLNSLNEQGAGFGTDTNKITILDNKNNVNGFELKNKKLVAKDIAFELAKHLKTLS